MSVQAVTDTNFEDEVLRSELPVLIDLYADWCQPCKQLSPIVAKLSDELAGKLKVVKVDIDKNPLVAESFRVQSIPMLVLIHEGRVAGHHVGLLDERSLRKMVEPVLPVAAAEVKPDELAKLLSAGRAVAVDIRDLSSYMRTRIPGAVHVPAADVAKRATELRPIDGRIRILYARSTDEAKTLSDELLAKGLEVGYLAGGFLHWEADGLPVERGN